MTLHMKSCDRIFPGSVWSWGDGGFGKLGHGSNETSKVPRIIQELRGVAKIKCGTQFSVALTKDGKVYTWYAIWIT